MSTALPIGYAPGAQRHPLIVAWITAHALGIGVFTVMGEPFEYGTNGLWFKPSVQTHDIGPYAPGDWHRTEAEASVAMRKLIRAEQRRLMRSFARLAVLDADVKAGWMPMVKGKTKPVERPSRRRV